MADDTARAGKGDEPESAELSDDDLAKVSGGSGPMIRIVPVKVNFSPGPGIPSLPDTQHGDPHVDG